MSTAPFARGDLVVVKPAYARPADRGVTYRITKVMPVNLVVEPVTGGRGLKAPKDMFAPAPTNPADKGATVETPVPLWPATVITVAGPGWKQPPGQLYVVLRDNGDKVSIARLGGDGGRYWRGVRRTWLTVIDPAHLTHTPPGT